MAEIEKAEKEKMQSEHKMRLNFAKSAWPAPPLNVQVADIEKAEKEKMRDKCEKIIAHGINCFVNRQVGDACVSIVRMWCRLYGF